MGTRHLVAVQIDGEYKVAQYGQWDGYPDGQGRDLLELLRGADLQALAEKCRAVRWATEEELKETYREFGADPDAQYVSIDISRLRAQKYPHLDRDAGAKVLAMILEAPPGMILRNSIDFAGDSLFCEWAYVVDFDRQTFEVYKGFNEEPLSEGERFKDAPRDKDDGKYYPVRHVVSWKLDDLPSEEAFLRAAKSKDEDEDE